MGVAIHKAQQMGSAVKLVGVSASLLAEPHSHSPDLLDIVQEGRNRFRVSRTGSPAEASFVGRLLYRLASYAVFGFSQGQLQRRMERDLMSVHDMATHLRLWGMFHPTLSQQHVELRNAVAMERVRRLVRTLSRWHSAQQPTANYHHSTPASEEPCVAGSDLDRKAIVVVTGKRNVVGMAAMWDEAVKNERFFTGRSATASNWIVTDHGVPDLVHTQQAAMEPADDAVASTAVQYDLPPWVDAVDATQPQTASLADRGGQQANAAAASPPATPEPLLLPTADSAVHPAVTDAAQKPLVEENNDPRPMSATDRARLFKQSKKAFKYVD
ncbi:hypothetical protein BC831DRAFT_515850 [Entophlyctis helioformis]|nr:hypothetical protein BC831DRAFT_515850 [Entophlyctis helioformis]